VAAKLSRLAASTPRHARLRQAVRRACHSIAVASRNLFAVVIAMQPTTVRMTGGPSWWDYVVGVSTILASVLALIAIWFAVKAGRDLVHDRRQVFELGVLVDVYETLETTLSDFGFIARVRLLPKAELPALHEYALDPRPPDIDEDSSGTDVGRIKYFSAIRERAKREVEQAIAKRTH
jgi:multisubunit Na+/H+ antiporter MnhF subunit